MKNTCHSSNVTLAKMSTWLAVPLNKFRGLKIHFQSSWTYVTHAYKFEGCAFKSNLFKFMKFGSRAKKHRKIGLALFCQLQQPAITL